MLMWGLTAPTQSLRQGDVVYTCLSVSQNALVTLAYNSWTRAYLRTQPGNPPFPQTGTGCTLRTSPSP